MIADIFYIATGVYKSYFEEFLKTLPNFLPGWEKRIIVVTDDYNYFNEYRRNRTTLYIYEQIDLPYPIIPLLKTHYISLYAPEDAEYIFYFDADTRFLKKSDEFWKEFIADIDRGDIVVSNHPANLYPQYKIAEDSKAYIPEGAFYFPIIASCYGGRADKVLELCEQMCGMIRHDLTTHGPEGERHYIPPLFDQDYLTKCVYNSDGLSFRVRYFVHIDWLHNEHDVDEENIVEQKYDVSRKFEKKNMV